MSWLKRNPKKRTINNVSTSKVVLIKQFLVGLLLATLLSALGYGLWHFTRMDSLTIKEVTVVGGETVSHQEVKNLVEQKLEGFYFHFVPRRFAWTYPKAEVLNAVFSQNRIKNVHLERDGGEKLIVAFEEYHPIALWCQQLTSQECLFLDSKGFAFAKAPVLQGGAFVRYSETGRMPEVKTEAFTGEFIEDTNSFVENAYNTLGLNIIQVEKQNDNDVLYHVAGGGIIKASTRMQSNETLENLAVILGSSEFEHLEPGNFKYIDLRFGNKVFVNEVMEEAVATTTETNTVIESEI